MKKGFTLIEILVSVTLFLVVMTVSMGAVVSIINTNRKVGSSKAVLDNINSAMELMSRQMRFGTVYHCMVAGDSKSLTQSEDCPFGGGPGVSFLSQDGARLVFRQNGSIIEFSTDGGASYTALTSPDVIIQSLTFFVIGTDPPPADMLQPRVVIMLKGLAGTDTNTTSFALETQVSQRAIDR